MLVEITQKTCLRCGHKWYPHSPARPMVCPGPKCHSPYWETKPRTKKKPPKVVHQVGVKEPKMAKPSDKTPPDLYGWRITSLFALGFPKEDVDGWIREFGLEKVTAAAKLTQDKMEAKEVENPAAFFVWTLKKGEPKLEPQKVAGLQDAILHGIETSLKDGQVITFAQCALLSTERQGELMYMDDGTGYYDPLTYTGLPE